MKVKKLHVFLTIFGLSLSLVSCDNDEKEKETIYDLIFGSESYVISHNVSPVEIYIASGNGLYDVTVDNEEVLLAESSFYMNGESSTKASNTIGFGHIAIRPVSTGETTIQVTDLVTEQQKTLKITILPPFMRFTTASNEARLSFENDDKTTESAIKNDMLKRTALQKETTFLLLKNEPVLYVLSKDQAIVKGSYTFENADSGPYVRFVYSVGEETKTSDLHLTKNGGGLYKVNSYFGLDWDLSSSSQSTTRLNFTPPPTILTIEDFTEMYKADYPNLKLALVMDDLTPYIPTILSDSFPEEVIEDMK